MFTEEDKTLTPFSYFATFYQNEPPDITLKTFFLAANIKPNLLNLQPQFEVDMNKEKRSNINTIN